MRGIGTVGENADHVLRKRLARRQKHGCRAHRYSRDVKGRILAESSARLVDPKAAVAPFVDAEGDDRAVARAGGALIDDDGISAKCVTASDAARKVALRIAAVAVEEDLQR